MVRKEVGSDGTFNAAVLIPLDTVGGPYTMWAVASQSQTTAQPISIAIPTDPTATQTPNSAVPGWRIAVTGNYFVPGELVTFRWGSASGPIVGKKNASSTGTFSGAILVPAKSSAGMTQVVLQGSLGSVSVDITVLAPPVASTAIIDPNGNGINGNNPHAGVGEVFTVSGANYWPGGDRVHYLTWRHINWPYRGES